MFALFLSHREHREKIEDTEVFLKSLCSLLFSVHSVVYLLLSLGEPLGSWATPMQIAIVKFGSRHGGTECRFNVRLKSR